MKAALCLLCLHLKFTILDSLLFSFSNIQSYAKSSPTKLAKQKLATKKNLKSYPSLRSVQQYSWAITALDEIQTIGWILIFIG